MPAKPLQGWQAEVLDLTQRYEELVSTANKDCPESVKHGLLSQTGILGANGLVQTKLKNLTEYLHANVGPTTAAAVPMETPPTPPLSSQVNRRIRDLVLDVRLAFSVAQIYMLEKCPEADERKLRIDPHLDLGYSCDGEAMPSTMKVFLLGIGSSGMFIDGATLGPEEEWVDRAVFCRMHGRLEELLLATGEQIAGLAVGTVGVAVVKGAAAIKDAASVSMFKGGQRLQGGYEVVGTAGRFVAIARRKKRRKPEEKPPPPGRGMRRLLSVVPSAISVVWSAVRWVGRGIALALRTTGRVSLTLLLRYWRWVFTLLAVSTFYAAWIAGRIVIPVFLPPSAVRLLLSIAKAACLYGSGALVAGLAVYVTTLRVFKSRTKAANITAFAINFIGFLLRGLLCSQLTHIQPPVWWPKKPTGDVPYIPHEVEKPEELPAPPERPFGPPGPPETTPWEDWREVWSRRDENTAVSEVQRAVEDAQELTIGRGLRELWDVIETIGRRIRERGPPVSFLELIAGQVVPGMVGK